MPVSISGNGVFTGLTTVETVDVKHPDSADVNIALADDGTIVLDSIPAAITAAIPKGIGSNVAQTVKTDPFSASIAAGALSSDVTGLTVSITPSSATSKILVDVNTSIDNSDAGEGTYITLFRDGTAIFIGDADGSKQRVASGVIKNINKGPFGISLRFLDSPATVSAVTYSVRLSHGSSSSSTVYLNRPQADANSNRYARGASSIIAIEVAA